VKRGILPIKHYVMIIVCFAVFCFFLSACQSPSSSNEVAMEEESLTEKADKQERPSSINGISIRTENSQYLTTADSITVITQNDSNEEFSSGTHVFLEKKVDGLWYKVPMKAEAFTEMALLHPPGESTTLSLNVQDLDYELTPGEYRALYDSNLAAPFEVIE
jgi:hypothetical protein